MFDLNFIGCSLLVYSIVLNFAAVKPAPVEDVRVMNKFFDAKAPEFQGGKVWLAVVLLGVIPLVLLIIIILVVVVIIRLKSKKKKAAEEAEAQADDDEKEEGEEEEGEEEEAGEEGEGGEEDAEEGAAAAADGGSEEKIVTQGTQDPATYEQVGPVASLLD